jgi:mannose-6-phosphate isomerase class I
MIIFFNIIEKEKIWGGTRLSSIYGLKNKQIGEVIGVSGHKLFANTIKSKEFNGKTLEYIYLNHRDLFGNLPLTEFPILIKLIDAKEDLSIQVHPNDEYALLNENSLGKEECWYILETDNPSNIIIGNHANSRIEIENLIYSNQLEEVLNYHPIKKGDFFYIPAGTIHAIRKNTLLLEVSQSSDITYRLYDYNRLQDGKPRDLHIKKSLDVIAVPDKDIIRNIRRNFFDFNILLKPEKRTANIYGDYLFIIDGFGDINDQEFKYGDFIMISSNTIYDLKGSFKIALINIVY